MDGPYCIDAERDNTMGRISLKFRGNSREMSTAFEELVIAITAAAREVNSQLERYGTSFTHPDALNKGVEDLIGN